MESELVDIGKISSRGQIAIPSDIRSQLGLVDGSKVLFFTEDDTLLLKKVTPKTFEQITKPLKAAAKKSDLKESSVSSIVHRFRKNVRNSRH